MIELPNTGVGYSAWRIWVKDDRVEFELDRLSVRNARNELVSAILMRLSWRLG